MSPATGTFVLTDRAQSHPRFQFVPVNAPLDGTKQTLRRAARSHAVKQAIEKKRRTQKQSSNNFMVTTVDMSRSRKVRRKCDKAEDADNLGSLLKSLSAGSLDPFKSLPVDSARLQMFLSHHKARKAPEPVFTLARELAFQDFYSVFRSGFDDEALLNAIMLSAAYTIAGNHFDQECLRYHGRAIRCIREKMASTREAASEATLGAILLLAGVEARRRATDQAKLHMAAVREILTLCQQQGIQLTSGIKRAAFWQDLNGFVLAGSQRNFDHTTFAELHWTRKDASPTVFQLPPGFEQISHLLDMEFIGVLKDLNALQCLRNSNPSGKTEAIFMERINSHTASIQSRLVSLPESSMPVKCCQLAAYLCSVMLCCTVWCGLTIPGQIAAQMHCSLISARNDSLWDNHPDLLLWLVCICGAFSIEDDHRTDNTAALRSLFANKLRQNSTTWEEALDRLKLFVWSDKAFKAPVKIFWTDFIKPELE